MPERYRQKYHLTDLYIQTKGDDDHPPEIVPFRPNPVQQLYLDQIIPTWESGEISLRGLREIVLKARQFGFSTLIQALMFLDTINNSNKSTVLIAHDGESTEILFQMVQRFYDHLPDGKPKTSYANKREIVFPELNSSIRVLTAGTKTSGRARTIYNLHMSEFAFWEHPEVLTGLLQAVTRGGSVFIETTANGAGNQFHEEYERAKNREQPRVSRTPFSARFFAWWEHDEYRIEPPEDFERDTEEEQLVELYGVDDWQLQWRRDKIAEPGMGPFFAQEYPANDDEAFKVTGSHYFAKFQTDGDDAHAVAPRFTPEKPPPAWYTFIAGVDPGFADPWAFGLGMIDETGAVTVLESDEEAGLGESDQADRIVRMADRWGIALGRITCLSGEDLWAKRHVDGIPVEAPVEKYYRAGINVLKASNDTLSQGQRAKIVREYIKQKKFWVYKGFNTKLINAMANAKHDPLISRRELPIHDKYSHLVYMIGCMVAQWEIAPEAPAPDITREEELAARLKTFHEDRWKSFLPAPEEGWGDGRNDNMGGV